MTKVLKNYAIAIILLVCVIPSFAQQGGVNIQGCVLEESTGDPIIGVSISVVNEKAGAASDVDGKFSVRVAKLPATLSVSYLGYTTVEVSVKDTQPLTIYLQESSSALDEVVVVGYGSGKRVGTVIGTVSTVKSGVIKERPSANVLDVLQGKVAGLQVYTSSGEPTALSSIRLHGSGSLGASSVPLYILDGVPVDAGTLLAINGNDIENVNVLSDASATSIYGSRGANGVIYVTTKRGVTNQEAKIRVNGQYGVSSVANRSFYENLMNSQQLTDFWLETGARTPETVEQLRKDYPNDTRWDKYFYEDNKPTYQGDISIQGGSDKTTYYVSGGYFYQEGTAPRSAYERYSARVNLESKPKSWLKIGVNLAGSYDIRDANAYTTINGNSNQINGGISFLLAPFYTPYDKDGKRYDYIPGANRYSPYYLADKNFDETKGANYNGTVYAEIYPVQGLTIRSQAGLDGYYRRNSAGRKPSDLANLNNGTVTEGYLGSATQTITNTAEYKFNIKDEHAFTLLAGQEWIDNDAQNFSARTTGVEDGRLALLINGKSPTVTHVTDEYAYLSFFGRADYNWQDKYFADFSVRNDRSSRFGMNKRSAIFFSGGLLWDAKQEDFLQDNDLISNLKLRFSVGSSGNSAIDNYQHLATVSTNTYNQSTGWVIGNAGNPDLTWEKQVLTTVGVNVEFIRKYNVKLSYYDKTTSNMLTNIAYPYTSGYGSIISNVGKLRNYGLDLTLDFDIFREKDWFVNFNTSLNYNWNKVVELYQGLDILPQWSADYYGKTYVVGQPVSYYYPIFAGIDPDDGLQTWYVPGDDITKQTKQETTKTYNNAGLRQNTNHPIHAPLNGGFGVNTGWKGIGLRADFAYSVGKYLFDFDRIYIENPVNYVGYNQSKAVLDYWKQPGDVANFPKYGQVAQYDTRFLEDASFLRLKTLTVAYDLPASLLRKTHFFSAIQVFATGRNLLTFTKYKGIDPEVDTDLTYGAYPNSKQFSFGASFTF